MRLTNRGKAGYSEVEECDRNRERCNLVRKNTMFVEDEAKISSRVGGVK